MDEAVSYNENFTAAYYERGLTNLALGNLDIGISDLEHYLKYAPKAIEREEIEIRIKIARDYGAEIAAYSTIYSTSESPYIIAPAPGKVSKVVTNYNDKDVTLIEITIEISGMDSEMQTQVIAKFVPVVNPNDNVLRGQIIGVIQEPLPDLKDRSMIFVLMENGKYIWSNDQWTIGGFPPFFYFPIGVFPNSN